MVTDFITGIDFDAQIVQSDTASYPYDYLILATGGAPEFFDTPGVQENSFSLWSFEDAIKIRDHFEERFRLAAKEPEPENRKRMLTFVVAGAGFTGIELIGEFLERRKVLCGKYHIDPRDVHMVVVEALDHVLPIIEPKLQKKAENYLRKQGAEIYLNSRITSADAGKVILQDGTEIATDTFVWTCGIHGSEFTSRISLTQGHTSRGECSVASVDGIHGMSGCRFDEDETYVVGKRGRILVTEQMASVDYSNVFAVGDNMWFLENVHVLPQIVETALQTAEVAAHNIIASLEGSKKKGFKSNFHGFMVSIGGRYGVSNAGGLHTSGFLAMAMKHLVNLHYLWGVAGLNAAWAYLKHEFFDMRDRRSFIGGHLSNKIQGWWAVPLRLWLGLMFLIEGVNKIGEGWLKFSSGSKSGWMFSPGVLQAGVQKAADSVAAATESAETTAETAVAVADTLTAATETAAAGADTAAAAWEGAEAFGPVWDTADVIIPWDSTFVTWFRETFMDGMAAYLPFPLFQTMIVLVEIAIGLAIMGGLFTFLASAAAILLCLVFTFSGMFRWDQLWFIFAAFLMLGGAGRGLGLDHWVMPWLKRWWNGTKLARRSHLFIGEPRVLNRKKTPPKKEKRD